MMNNLAIIGGAGFIGTNLCKRLEAQGIEFTIFDNGLNSLAYYKFDYLELGTTSQEELCDLLNGYHTVINLAAATRVQDSITEPDLTFQSNIKGFYDLLETCRKLKIRKIINASTGGAIAGNVPPPITEDSRNKPESLYGASKLFNEAMCHAYNASHSMESVNLRFTNVYGPFSKNKQSAIHLFCKSAVDKQPITVFGDGRQKRDFLFVEDVITAIISVLSSKFHASVLQLGTNIGTSLLDVISTIENMSNHKFEIHFKPGLSGEVVENYCDPSLMRRAYNWEASTNIRDGIFKTLQYYRDLQK